MRKASEQDYFPYTDSTTCYVIVNNENNSVSNTRPDSTIIEQARKNEIQIFAVWPGKWKSDLFEIDDLDKLAEAFGIRPKSNHEHDIDWKINSHYDTMATWIFVDFQFACDCYEQCEKELNGYNGLTKFANQMYEQKGWRVATSVGYSGGSYPTDANGKRKRDTYTIKVQRTTLN